MNIVKVETVVDDLKEVKSTYTFESLDGLSTLVMEKRKQYHGGRCIGVRALSFDGPNLLHLATHAKEVEKMLRENPYL